MHLMPLGGMYSHPSNGAGHLAALTGAFLHCQGLNSPVSILLWPEFLCFPPKYIRWSPNSQCDRL